MQIKPLSLGNALSQDNSVPVPRQTSFHVPEGTYRAVVHSIRKGANISNPNLVRITFKIQLPGVHIDYLAKLDLKADLSEGSDLWQVVCNLASRKALQNASETSFDLNTLVELEADIEITHITNRAADYDYPFVVVCRVESAGRLVREEVCQ